MDYGDYNVFDGLELMVQITPCTVDESLNLYLKNVAIILVMYQRGENVTTCYIMCKKKKSFILHHHQRIPLSGLWD